MNFEWDDEKNRENLRKHGFDFNDAWQVFQTPVLDELDERSYYGEQRWNGIGLLGDRIVAITYTFRSDDTIRIISLRKALKHEREKFEQGNIRN